MAWYDTFDTDLGTLFVGGSDAGVHRIDFLTPEHDLDVEIGRLEADCGETAAHDTDAARPAVEALTSWFVDADSELDLPLAPRGTPFQERVWERLRAIPPGATTSYGEIALDIGQPGAGGDASIAREHGGIRRVSQPVGRFNRPTGVCVDKDGDVYVADWRNDRIQKFSPDGRFLASYGERGDGDGQFNRPADVAVDRGGYIYVADWGNERVQVLDGEGRFLASYRGESRDSQWAQDYFAANPDEAAGRRSANLEPEIPARPEFDQHRGYEWERSANVEKLFWGPTSVKIGPDGQVFIVDSLRHRIQIYRPDS